jgi:hypothetical protein
MEVLVDFLEDRGQKVVDLKSFAVLLTQIMDRKKR